MILAGGALLCSLASCVRVGSGRASVWDVCVWGAVPLSLVSALCWWWLGVRFCGHSLGFSGGAVVRGCACGHHEPPALGVYLAAWDFCIFSFRLGLAREPWFLCDFSA